MSSLEVYKITNNTHAAARDLLNDSRGINRVNDSKVEGSNKYFIPPSLFQSLFEPKIK